MGYWELVAIGIVFNVISVAITGEPFIICMDGCE